VDRYQDVYPTKQQTGTELFELVHLASGAFPRVTLYFENSILRPDLALLPAAGAILPKVRQAGNKLTVDAEHALGVKWEGAANVDGKPWPVADSSTVWLPAGTHTLEPGAPSFSPRVLDFNGELVSAERRGGSSVEVSYQSSSRALALLDRKPVRLELDGGNAPLSFLASGGNYTLVLPRGQHLVMIHTE
jgi:hypothetical protein